MKYIVGYSIPHVDRLQDIVYNLIANAHHFNWMECALGLTWIAILLLIKNAPRFHKCAALKHSLTLCFLYPQSFASFERICTGFSHWDYWQMLIWPF